MKSILSIIFIIILLLYEKVHRKKICKKKIIKHIERLGGELDEIKKLTPRDEIYMVYYTADGQKQRSTVEFSLFYDETWN